MKKEKSKLEKVLAALNKKYGDGTISLGSAATLDLERVKSGIAALDLVIGGGIPRSKMIEFFGREASGKTSIALKIVGAYQKQGLVCAYVDTEHFMDPAWAITLGVDMDKLLVSQPDTLEEAVDIIDTLTRSRNVDLIVYDSLAASVPVEEAEKSANDQQMALQARLFAKMCRKLNAALQPENLEDNDSYNKTTTIFINQVREKVGAIYARGYETPGGHAVKHTAKIRIEFKGGEHIKEKGNPDPIGIEVKFRTVKNQTFRPYKTGLFKLFFDGTIDNDETIFMEAKKYGVIHQGGPMYSYGDLKEKGFENFIKVLKEKNLFEEVTEKVYNLTKKSGYNLENINRPSQGETEVEDD